jgi:CCR4-NOT transcriptional complex subunit CAF120
MVVHGPSDDANDGTATPSKSKRVSTLLSHHESAKPSGVKKPTISIYESDKPKDMKKAAVSMTLVKQAFAVFPERPELINHSTLIKVEGRIGDEHTAGVMKGQEGWLLIMPETDSGCNPTAEMLRWIVGPSMHFSSTFRVI